MATTTARRLPRSRGDSGFTTVQTLLWAPWLFLLALGGTQAVAYGWAYMAARHATEQAVQTTRVQGGTATQGETVAAAVLAQATGGLTDIQIDVTRDADLATASITATPIRIVPLTPLPRIQVHAQAPVERFRPPQDPP